ncbi:CaiB/BaiF CoA transferase family protein [Candidatus Entotheonella palauensis]|uniref:CaiB/BaiF CoA transferase family protein n=1 Tax=Candidatus Entotheonella palauensis TaxID=93172 RepID=UPI000B7CC533|nr:CoA transferase [Candidatus Entotheonella palauensis]
MPDQPPSHPLSDIRVLDISEEVAGPFCTKLLAGLGAEVIKIETPGTGDVSRRSGPFVAETPGTEQSALFLYLNTGKKGITLDIRQPTGAAMFQRLVQDCDILVESAPPGEMDRLGLGYAALAHLNARLIYTAITPFGQTGPYRDYQGSELVAQATGGMMHVIGRPDREPLKIGGHAAAYTTGMSAFSATMLALHVRDEHGHGQYVDVSAMETMAVSQIHASIQHQFGHVPKRRESSLVRARDGWVHPGLDRGIAEDTWARVCDLMGQPELADDSRFNTAHARRENQSELSEIIGAWAAAHPKEEIYHTLQGLRTVAGYVATVEDLRSSGQLNARDFFQTVDHPSMGEGVYPGALFTLQETSWQHGRAPLLGEHNDDIYGKRLGYSRESLQQLHSVGII